MLMPDPARDSRSSKAVVSIIVPARNEEAGLTACLESLVSQTGVHFEIIVVDDGSTDRTVEIAQSFSAARVIHPGPIPLNWTGKNNAVSAGAQQAQGEWLLFTDADTVHLPGSLARALIEADRQGASLLSYSPEQEVHGFWEKAIMPVIFAELDVTYSPSQVSDPRSQSAAANGQYILISREAYDAVGGHAAIATSLLEDVELARAVKAPGRKICFRYGGDAVRTRMYRSFAQLREGWTKNLALLFPSPLRLAITRLAEFLLILGDVVLVIIAAIFRQPEVAGIAAVLVIFQGTLFFQRIRRAHFSWDASALALFGLPIFSYLLFRSRLAYKRNRVIWKGRTYTTSGQVPPANPGDVQMGAATKKPMSA